MKKIENPFYGKKGKLFSLEFVFKNKVSGLSFYYDFDETILIVQKTVLHRVHNAKF